MNLSPRPLTDEQVREWREYLNGGWNDTGRRYALTAEGETRLLGTLDAAKAEVARLREALSDLLARDEGDLSQRVCHVNIIPAERCSYCGPVLRGRAALAQSAAAAEGR